MSNVNPAGDYIAFGLDIMTIEGSSQNATDIINSSQLTPEGGVNDGVSDGDNLFD